MEALIRELIPHDPALGLFVDPYIPTQKLRNAIGDYGRDVDLRDVVALYDATLLGSGKDGALFLADRFIFQNNDLQPSYEVRYEDVVGLKLKKKLMGGRSLELGVNRGRATIELEMDFSGKTKAAPYVKRYLEEAMHRITDLEMEDRSTSASSQKNMDTNVRLVEETLMELVNEGVLSREDYRKMMQVLT